VTGRTAARTAPRSASRTATASSAVDQASDAFEALGDHNRRAILALLGEGERSVQALADELPISRPAVSRHLRLLRSAGLVSETREGTRRIYRLRTEGVDAVRRYLEQVWGEAATRFTLTAENTRRRGGRA
jgi:DNA-binding transcriptional ArsR family regulator